jgi:uncharacterized glyoxalase superfamily protein PhnB
MFIAPVLRYHDGPAAIEWLVRAFGFERHAVHLTPEGSVAHADLRLGRSVIGLSSMATSAPGSPWAPVRQGIYVCVDNPDAAHDRAVAAAAEIVIPLTDTDYGSREFSLRDLEGHLWAFGTYNMGALSGDPTIWAEVRYRDAATAVAWLERAIGFTRAVEVPGDQGGLMHAELWLGESVFMLGPEVAGEWADVRQATSLRVDDPDRHFAAARAAGAVIVREPQTAPYGARFYSVRDPEGFLWWVTNYKPAPPAFV